MTRYHIESIIHVLKLTPARRAIALRRVRRKLDKLPAAQAALLLEAIERSLLLQRESLLLKKAKRKAKGQVMHAQGARALDGKLDKLLSMLDNTLQGFMELFEGEKTELAAVVRDAVFDDGVSPITSKPFVEQHELIIVLIHDLRTGDVGAAIDLLGLGTWVDRLEELNVTYGQQITRPERISLEVVRAADLRAWVSLIEVVALVIGLFPTNEEAHIAQRELLLKPIVEQEEEAALLRARQSASGAPEEDDDLDEEDADEEDADEEDADE